MPAPLFTTEQIRNIKAEYREYRDKNGPMTKFAWTTEKAKQLGCAFITIKKIILRLPPKKIDTPWTLVDDNELKRLVEAGLNDRGVAKRMGRTWKSVQNRRQRLGILTQRSQLEEYYDRITALLRLGYYDREIGKEIGYSRTAITAFRKKHRLKCGRFHEGWNSKATGERFHNKRTASSPGN